MSPERKTFLRTFCIVLVGMTLAMGLVRLFAWANDASGRTFLARVVEAREALPQILEEPQDLVMVFGTSMVHAGFSARHFDREVNARGGNIKSWNFGFGGLNPYFQDFLSRRIREDVEASGRKLRLTLIEFNPFQTTQTRWNRALPIRDGFLTMLASDRELLEIALDDPERGALLYNIKYFRDDVSAEMVTTFFGGMFDERPEVSDRPGLTDEQQERLDEISEDLNERFEAEYPDYEPHAWNYAWQGAGTVPWERPADTVAMFPEYFSLHQNEKAMDDDLQQRIRSADILDLEFEELLIEHFMHIVENFKAVSEEVEVILLPRNTDWVQYTPEVEARLQAVIERIERETGVPVRNQQVIPEITPAAFSDTTHLGRYIGDIPWTEYLVEQYAERLVD